MSEFSQRLIMAILAAMIVLAPTATHAAIEESSIEVGPYFLHARFDDDSNVEDDMGIGARLGIVFEEQHELEFSFDWVDTNDDLGLGLDVDITTIKIGYVLNFLPRAPVSPLFTIGGGFQQLDVSGFLVDDQETDMLLYGGFGVRFFIGDSFNIRLDGQTNVVFADDDFGDEETLIDGLFLVGVGWFLGD